jgi:hypothetical protein
MVMQLGNVRAAAYELKVEHLFSLRAKVTAKCLACDHEGDVDALTLLGKWGKHGQLTKIEEKLKCTACKVRGFCRLQIEWTM